VEDEPTLDELEALTRIPREKLARTCRISRFALGAVGRLRDLVGPLDGAGIVLGHALATHETNAIFWEGIRKRGARLAEPRRFPFTSPNAACGECSIAYRLTGPGFAVGLGGAGGLEALSVAATLVRGGRAERLVVVAADDVGPASLHELEGPSGAVALVVTALPNDRRYELLSADVTVSPASSAVSEGPLAPAHRALLPLTEASSVESLESGPSRGVFGRVRLARV
jgi:3-oxoacyl-[acyl-carrier-protein] synthase-1/3-oxoacyl-[acyl-carrier-protein] synthase II